MDEQKKKIKVFISQPMRGKTVSDILKIRNSAKEFLQTLFPDVEITVPDNIWRDVDVEGWHELSVEARAVVMMAKSIKVMARCDAVYLVPGWEKARGCRIEHDIAREYGLKII